MVMTSETLVNSLDMNGLAPGVYVVKNEYGIAHRIIKQ